MSRESLVRSGRVALLVSFLLLPLFSFAATPGDKVLTLSGTNTVTDWNLQQKLVYPLTGPSTNTHINVPTSATSSESVTMRVTGNGTYTLDFLLSGVSTNWTSAFTRTPRNGTTIFTFDQIGNAVSISASPDPGASGGGSTNGITDLTGEVLATGPGSAPSVIATNAVTTVKIAASAVVETNLANLSVSSGKLIDSSVITSKIAASAVVSTNLANNAVTTAKVLDRNITDSKIEYSTTPKTSAAGTITFDLAGSRRQTNSESGSLTVALSNVPSTSIDRWIVAQFTPASALTLTWPATFSGVDAVWVPTTNSAVTSVSGGAIQEVAIGYVGGRIFLANMYATGSGASLSTNLTAFDNTSGTGIPVRTDEATPTWVFRSIQGTANQVVVADGDGILGNPTLSLPSAPIIADFSNAPHSHADAIGGSQLTETALALTDNTTNNASTTQHGFLRKLSGTFTEFMAGDGVWRTPVSAYPIDTTTTTTNDTDKVIYSLASSDATAFFTVFFSGGGETNSAGYRAEAAYRVVGTTPTLIGTNIVSSIETDSALGVGFQVNGTVMELVVKGFNNENMNWAVKGNYLLVANANPVTSRIITEGGDYINTEGGDRLITE
jgi:hypothetical protein